MKFTIIKALVIMILSFYSFTSIKANEVECPFTHLDGEKGRQYLESLISYRMVKSIRLNEDNELNNLMSQLENDRCKLADGRAAISFTRSGLNKAFKKIRDNEVILKKLKKLQGKYPEGIYPHIAEANFWIYYAWDARGNGYASSVTPEGWKLFRERLAKAEKILIDNKEKASRSPVWYHLMFEPVFHLNYSQDEKDKFYVEAFEKHKGFLPLYILKRNQLRPRWGGSWKEVDEFINWVSNDTKNIEGAGMYARLYFGVYDNLRKNEKIFSDTHADWTKLKSGLESLTTLYPKSIFHKNVFALMACEAKDISAYHQVRKNISDTSKWPWSSRLDIKSCDKGLGYSKDKAALK